MPMIGGRYVPDEAMGAPGMAALPSGPAPGQPPAPQAQPGALATEAGMQQAAGQLPLQPPPANPAQAAPVPPATPGWVGNPFEGPVSSRVLGPMGKLGAISPETMRHLLPILVGSGLGAGYGALSGPNKPRRALIGALAGAGGGAGLSAGNAFLDSDAGRGFEMGTGTTGALLLGLTGLGTHFGVQGGRRAADVLGLPADRKPQNDLEEADLLAQGHKLLPGIFNKRGFLERSCLGEGTHKMIDAGPAQYGADVDLSSYHRTQRVDSTLGPGTTSERSFKQAELSEFCHGFLRSCVRQGLDAAQIKAAAIKASAVHEEVARELEPLTKDAILGVGMPKWQDFTRAMGDTYDPMQWMHKTHTQPHPGFVDTALRVGGRVAAPVAGGAAAGAALMSSPLAAPIAAGGAAIGAKAAPWLGRAAANPATATTQLLPQAGQAAGWLNKAKQVAAPVTNAVGNVAAKAKSVPGLVPGLTTAGGAAVGGMSAYDTTGGKLWPTLAGAATGAAVGNPVTRSMLPRFAPQAAAAVGAAGPIGRQVYETGATTGLNNVLDEAAKRFNMTPEELMAIAKQYQSGGAGAAPQAAQAGAQLGQAAPALGTAAQATNPNTMGLGALGGAAQQLTQGGISQIPGNLAKLPGQIAGGVQGAVGAANQGIDQAKTQLTGMATAADPVAAAWAKGDYFGAATEMWKRLPDELKTAILMGGGALLAGGLGGMLGGGTGAAMGALGGAAAGAYGAHSMGHLQPTIESGMGLYNRHKPQWFAGGADLNDPTPLTARPQPAI